MCCAMVVEMSTLLCTCTLYLFIPRAVCANFPLPTSTRCGFWEEVNNNTLEPMSLRFCVCCVLCDSVLTSSHFGGCSSLFLLLTTSGGRCPSSPKELFFCSFKRDLRSGGTCVMSCYLKARSDKFKKKSWQRQHSMVPSLTHLPNSDASTQLYCVPFSKSTIWYKQKEIIGLVVSGWLTDIAMD